MVLSVGWLDRGLDRGDYERDKVTVPVNRSTVVILLAILIILVVVGVRVLAEKTGPVSWSQFLQAGGWLLMVAVLVVTVGVGFAVILRFLGRFPTELDRIGSDLNLYGYGVAIALFGGTLVGRPGLAWVDSGWGRILVFGGGILTLLLYGCNLYISGRIRNLNQALYVHGLDDAGHFAAAWQDPEGRRLIVWSLGLGLFPTILFTIADLSSH